MIPPREAAYNGLMSRAFLVTAAAMALLGAGNGPDKRGDDPVACKASVNGYFNEAVFSFACGPATCTLPAPGKGACVYEDGSRREFAVPLEDQFFIETVFCFPYETDLILLIQDGDGEGSGSRVVRLGGKDLRAIWQADYPAFNTGDPLVREGFAYVTGIGFVGKIDLASGRFEWSHKDLYEQPDVFNSFGKPVKEGRIIVFRETPSIFGRKDVRVLKVDDATGKILEGGKAAAAPHDAGRPDESSGARRPLDSNPPPG